MEPYRIEDIINRYGKDRENLMLILRDLESLSGNNMLDAGILEEVAVQMNVPESAVAGFISFYSMFRTYPRARYVIRVCRSGPCHVMGSTDIFREIQEILGIREGETTSDGLFHLEGCECLGICHAAPAMMVNFNMHGNLDSLKLKDIFNKYREGGASFPDEPGSESESGMSIIDSGDNKRLLADIGKYNFNEIDTYIENGGYRSLKKALERDSADIIDEIIDSGLRGRGGAGFPAGLKWSFVKKGNMQKYVVCNADEGEPGTFKDRILMEENPHLLIEGMAVCGYAIDASLGCIYVRGEYRKSIEILKQAITRAKEKGFLGKNIAGTDFSFDIFIKEGGGAYVCGEETALISSMEGKRGCPGFKPPFPGSSGFKGMPTNVNNVETLMSVPQIILNGAEWYKSSGLPGCSGTKLYSLSGKLNRPGLVELPMGVTLGEIIDTYGGGMKSGSRFKFAQVGGSAGGIIGEDSLDIPLDIDGLVKKGLTLGSGSVLVADRNTCAVDFLFQILGFFKHESCGRCVPCRAGTSQLYTLAGKFVRRIADPEDIESMIKRSEMMKTASLCALGQSPAMPVVTMIRYFRDEFIRHCDRSYKCDACDRTLKANYSH